MSTSSAAEARLKAAGARVITIYHAERKVVFPNQLEGECSEFIEQQLMTREDARVHVPRAGPASSSAPSSSPDSIRGNDGSNDSSQGQDDIPRAGANASSHHEPVIDLTQDVPRTVAARGRHRSRSRGAKGKGKVGVDKVKEALEELGYVYCSAHSSGMHIMQTPPDMTESQLEALRAKILETRNLRS